MNNSKRICLGGADGRVRCPLREHCALYGRMKMIDVDDSAPRIQVDVYRPSFVGVECEAYEPATVHIEKQTSGVL